MPTFDTAGAAALADEVQRPAYFIFADISGLPVRVTTAGYPVPFAGTGDPDLDGHMFDAADPRVIDISPVTQGESGSETVTITISGIASLDAATIAALEDRTLYQGRVLRLWKLMRAEDGTAIGAIVPYHTGWMSKPVYNPAPEGQTISMAVEGYLAAITGEASNRSYSGQASFDAADVSALATVGAANGVKTGPGSSIGYAGGGDGGGSAGGGGAGSGYFQP